MRAWSRPRSTARGRSALLAAGLAWLPLACGGVGMERRDPADAPVAFLETSPVRAELPPPEGEPSGPGGPPAGDLGREYVLSPARHRAPRPRIAGEELVSLELRGSSLPQTLHLLAESAGVNLYLDADLGGTLDASFPSVTLDAALEAILGRNGLELVEDPPGIFWVRRADGTQAAVGRFQLRSIHAADVRDSIASLASGSVVVVDENQNVVLISGPQREVDLVADFLAASDRLKRQVLVEVSVFEVSLSDNFRMGVTSQIPITNDGRSATILQNLGSTASRFSLVLDDPKNGVEATIDLLRRYVNLDLVSSPRVLTVTNTEALIEFIEEVPYVNVTSTTSGTTAGVGSTVVEEVQFKEAGIKLKVLPIIQEGGILQVAIDQELSEVVDFFNDIPVIDTRKLSSRFLVADGQTIVMGGLMQNRKSRTHDGVPLLMHLPLVGHLFRNRDDRDDRRELLVFLTPRILDPLQAAALGEAYEQRYRERWSEMGLPTTYTTTPREPR